MSKTAVFGEFHADDESFSDPKKNPHRTFFQSIQPHTSSDRSSAKACRNSAWKATRMDAPERRRCQKDWDGSNM
jgi:hypothetical protein